MNLEEFTETTLTQIISGVKKAQKTTMLKEKHISEADVINPQVMYNADSAPQGKYYITMGGDLVHFVDFDVAVTTDSSTDTKGGLSIKIASIGVEGGKGVTDRDTVISRIKFQVPVILPKSKA